MVSFNILDLHSIYFFYFNPNQNELTRDKKIQSFLSNHFFHLVSNLWFLKMREHIMQLDPSSSFNLLLKKEFGIPCIELCVDDIRSLLYLSLSMQSLMILSSEPPTQIVEIHEEIVLDIGEKVIFSKLASPLV